MSKYHFNCVRYRHFLRTSNISQIPDFTKYCIGPVNEELAPYIMETMKAYPSNSKYINPQHYYHNRTVLVDNYLKRNPNPVSLTQLAQYYDDSTKLTRTKIINSGKFVKGELVIRIAHKLDQLQQLPFNVVNNFHFVQVYESYYNIFESFRKYPTIRTLEDASQFADFIKSMLEGFNTLNLPHLIMGALECTILNLYPREKMDELLSDLLRARISRRLIVEEHVSITANYTSGKRENTLVLGDIFQECNAKKYLLEASEEAQKFIQDMYFKDIPMPEFIVEGDTQLTFYFLPTHLKYLLGEILRNTYEATMKHYIRKGLEKPQPIIVTVVSNDESYLFRISDKAGGILHDDENLWSFGKSKERAQESLNNFHKLPGLQTVSIYDQVHSNTNYSPKSKSIPPMTLKPYMHTSLEPMSYPSIINGHMKYETPLIELLKRSFRYKLGIGLAMCKVYAEYWNGDLSLHSMPGYGTDVVLKLGNLMKHTEKLQLDKV